MEATTPELKSVRVHFAYGRIALTLDSVSASIAQSRWPALIDI